jgi:hypothetical protein
MNERIKQLAEQAGLKHHNWITNESNVKDGDFKYPRLEDYKKFAELIVKECDRYVAEQYDECEPWMQPGDLLKHFGVRE